MTVSHIRHKVDKLVHPQVDHQRYSGQPPNLGHLTRTTVMFQEMCLHFQICNSYPLA